MRRSLPEALPPRVSKKISSARQLVEPAGERLPKEAEQVRVMPILCEFNTGPLYLPNSGFVARPRLPHGFRKLDIDKNANIRVKATSQHSTRTWVDCHITTWHDTTLYSAVENVFVIPPANMQYLTGEHMRNIVSNPNDPASVRVDFERPFITPPKVITFLNYIDLDKRYNWRLKTTAVGIDVNGFTLNIETWGDTILYAAQACWIAYPEDEPHIFSMSTNTTDIRPCSTPQLQNCREITFNNIEFLKDPAVFVALNSLDIGCDANLRIDAYVDGVSRTGLTWHIDTWHDTVLYSAGASIIAFH